MTDLSPAARVEAPDTARSREGLSPWASAMTRAVAATLFATEEGDAPADRLDWLCDDLDDFLARSGARSRAMFRLCLTAIAYVAPLYAKRLGPFHALDAPTRARALERMERGPFGLALFGAKALLCIVWYEHPAVALAAGHDGGCLNPRAQ